MNQNDQSQTSRFSQNLSTAFKTLTDIALHPCHKENDIKSITECVLQKRHAKSTNPNLQHLRRELTSTCHELLNEPAKPVFYIQIQEQSIDIVSSIDATKQKLIDLPEKLKAAVGELGTSESSYVLAVTDGNDIEQDEIEANTNKCKDRVSTLKMMIKSCHLSLELNNARSALLKKLLSDQENKYKAVLFKPLHDELANATNEFCKVLERIYGAALVVPNLNNGNSKEHPVIESILEKIKGTAHDQKALEAHGIAFSEESNISLSSNAEL